IVFYAVIGWANLVVALKASQKFWVNFNVFGLTLATAAFIGVQVVWLMRQMPSGSEDSPEAG
ncbi:MAG: septation protein IspZ, partial [Steroidobacteraceae bacterium]